eukprot:jgi/Hompol1/895/HPOL_001455-RA
MEIHLVHVTVKSREYTHTATRVPTTNTVNDPANSNSSSRQKSQLAPGSTTREIDITVRDIEIIDNVFASQWRKFFSYMQPEANMLPRETGSDMLCVSLKAVQPDKHGDEEMRLK